MTVLQANLDPRFAPGPPRLRRIPRPSDGAAPCARRGAARAARAARERGGGGHGEPGESPADDRLRAAGGLRFGDFEERFVWLGGFVWGMVCFVLFGWGDGLGIVWLRFRVEAF